MLITTIRHSQTQKATWLELNIDDHEARTLSELGDYDKKMVELISMIEDEEDDTATYMRVAPEEIGALTDCDLIIAKNIKLTDTGEVIKAENFFWHERYQLEIAVDVLIEKKTIRLNAS